ncbi:MAG TPA: diguanylate cyclase [Micromonosporaceae bacterium]
MDATIPTGDGASWRSLRSDRVLVWAAVAGVGWLAMYSALTSVAQDSHALTLFVGDVLYLVPIAVAVVLSVPAARRSRGRVRRAWRMLVVSNALWLVGEVIWTLYAFLTPDGAPVPSAADAGYLLSYVVALPALLVGLGVQGWLGRTRGLLDAALVAGAGGAIGWQLVIKPIVPGAWDAAAVTTFIYPVFSVSIVSVLLAVLLSGRQRVPRSILVAGVAFGFAAVSDAGYAYLSALNAYTDASWLNVGWEAEAVLLSLGALIATRSAEGGERQPQTAGDTAILPALVAVLALAGLALFDLVEGGALGAATTALIVLLFMGLLLRQAIAARDRTHLAQQLRLAAITDSLTGLYNRRFFDQMLASEADLATRQRRPLSLILLDLDHFKEVNDTYGHSAGDAVLVEAANRLKRSLRADDVVSRYGGEEFIVLLPATDERTAVDLAERLRLELGSTSVTIPSGDQVRLTASLGVATADPSHQIDVDKLVNAADKAVYQAKARGRDRVAGSDLCPLRELYGKPRLPRELVWIADRIDAMLSDREHSAAIARWSMRTAARLGLDPATQYRTAAAARLHDIGKIGISRDLLAKPTELDESEWEQMRRHPQESARLLTEIGDRPDLAPLVAAHHERYDGTGYPEGLAGDDIPIEARIIAVCDAWSAMRTNRPYSPALTECEAREQLERSRGSRFDPNVVDAFLALVDEGDIDEAAPLGEVVEDAEGTGEARRSALMRGQPSPIVTALI